MASLVIAKRLSAVTLCQASAPQDPSTDWVARHVWGHIWGHVGYSVRPEWLQVTLRKARCDAWCRTRKIKGLAALQTAFFWKDSGAQVSARPGTGLAGWLRLTQRALPREASRCRLGFVQMQAFKAREERCEELVETVQKIATIKPKVAPGAAESDRHANAFCAARHLAWSVAVCPDAVGKVPRKLKPDAALPRLGNRVSWSPGARSRREDELERMRQAEQNGCARCGMSHGFCRSRFVLGERPRVAQPNPVDSREAPH